MPISKNGCTLNDLIIDDLDGYISVFLNVTGNPYRVVAPTWLSDGPVGTWYELTASTQTKDGRTFNYYYKTPQKISGEYNTHIYILCTKSNTAYNINTFYTEENRYLLNNRSVTYDANGGTTTSSKTFYNPGYKVALPTNTTIREGYTFLGWSKEKDGNVLTEYRMKSDSITLYAQWIKNSNY